MADLLDVLADARAALLAIPSGPTVLVAGDPDPGDAELLVLDRVAETPLPQYRHSPTTKRVQVVAYAATLERALELSREARTALRLAGFQFLGSRPAPDPDAVGDLAEYRR